MVCTLANMKYTIAFFNVLVVSMHAFAPNHAVFRMTTQSHCGKRQLYTKSSLHAVADPPFVPAEHQDEDEKRLRENDGVSNEEEWTATEGGFFANLAARTRRKNKVEVVDNIHDYKTVVVDEMEKVVVVRFHASWCKSCKASEPYFKKLVNKYSKDVKFVEVPLTKETAYLQEGLGVPSVPFAHIYYPDVGLVEEMKISKPHFRKFRESLISYVRGSCDVNSGPLPEDEDSFQ